MKKIFTLIAAALMAVGANAMEDIDLNKINGFEFGKSLTLGEWDWKGATISTGELVVDNDAKTADDSGVTYFDASAYDYIVIYYSACQGNVLLLSQYNCLGTVGQWGAEFNQESASVNATTEATYAALKLNPDLKNKINQVVLQGGAGGGSITVDAAWFMTEAEWEEVKPAPAQTKDLFGSFSATTTNGDGSKTFTETSKSYGWFGAWLGGFDASEFDYFILEIAPTSEVGVQVLIQHPTGADIVGVAQAGETILKVALDPERKNAINQIGLQNIAPGSFTLTAAYFATQDYVDNMAKPTTSELAISGFNVWKEEGTETPRADFDPATGKITMGGGEQGGGGSWWFGSKDCSDFDNFVLELENTPAGGKVVVQYKDGSTDECEFGVGATAVVIPLDADKKSEIQQVWVQGNDGNSFTMTKAYFAAESATPEANIGTIENGISNIQVAKTQNGAIFNLAGQQVSKAVKGVYIQNGKKFVVK